MKITRTSLLTGCVNTMEINVTPEQLVDWATTDALVQDALPHLTANEREFLLSGATPAEWDAAFPPDEEE